VCVCVCVCVRGLKEKRLKSYYQHWTWHRYTVHASRSACVDPKVKRSKVKVTWLSNALPTCTHMPAAHLTTLWPWPLTVWPQGLWMPQSCHCHRAEYVPSLMLIAQLVFLLERACTHRHTVTDATEHSTHASVITRIDNKTDEIKCAYRSRKMSMDDLWRTTSGAVKHAFDILLLLLSSYIIYCSLHNYTDWEKERQISSNIHSRQHLMGSHRNLAAMHKYRFRNFRNKVPSRQIFHFITTGAE